jgi:hypothetical protein
MVKMILLIIFSVLFLFIVYLTIFSLCKIVKKSNDAEKMEQEKGDCFSCIWYQTKGCPVQSIYLMKDCPYFVPLIPFA